MKSGNKAKKSLYLLLLITIMLLSGTVLWLNTLISRMADYGSGNGETYQYHFAMVVGSSGDIFWDMVYEGAQDSAAAQNCYVELMQDRQGTPYSLADQLNMAFAAKVDGIFLAPDGSEEVENALLRNAQAEHPIPLLTVLEHRLLPGSLGYVGIDDAQLSGSYSALVKQLIEEGRACDSLIMLGANDSENAEEDRLFSFLRRDLSVGGLLNADNVWFHQVDQSNIFNCKRDIRSLLTSDAPPDILVCPDFQLTISACQVAVEQNLVGKISILGSYANDDILSYIQKGTLYGTVATDPKDLGQICADELATLMEEDPQYTEILLELITIDRSNVKQFRTLYAQEGRR